jgi:4-hydroxybenzoate polyprenyltransferase
MFLIATVSLLLAGRIHNPVSGLPETLLILWLGICGTLFIYGTAFGYHGLKNWKMVTRNIFSSSRKGAFAIQFILIAIPLSLIYLPAFELIALGCIGLLGLLYSFDFSWNGTIYRVKDLPLIKNVFIGFGWGILLLAGAGTVHDEKIIALFVFMSFQILLGSIVRDIFDIKIDFAAGQKTLPVILGSGRTIKLIHICNILTFFVGYALSQSREIALVMLLVIMWKGIILFKVSRDINSHAWTQSLNILTCFFLLLILLIQHTYGH